MVILWCDAEIKSCKWGRQIGEWMETFGCSCKWQPNWAIETITRCWMSAIPVCVSSHLRFSFLFGFVSSCISFACLYPLDRHLARRGFLFLCGSGLGIHESCIDTGIQKTYLIRWYWCCMSIQYYVLMAFVPFGWENQAKLVVSRVVFLWNLVIGAYHKSWSMASLFFRRH